LGWVETEHGGDRAAVGFELWAVDFHALVDRPGIVGRDGAGDAAEQLGITSLLVSISHCHTHATAFAVAVGESGLIAWLDVAVVRDGAVVRRLSA
jgi:hypothetical protein